MTDSSDTDETMSEEGDERAVLVAQVIFATPVVRGFARCVKLAGRVVGVIRTNAFEREPPRPFV